jgi:hypothetical protein
MDDDLLIFLSEAALELRLPDTDQAPGVVVKAMLAVGHCSVSQVLAWDLGRLKSESGLVSRDDKLAYVSMLKGPGGDQLGATPLAVDLTGLMLDRVARTCKEVATPTGGTTAGNSTGQDEVAERKKSYELYEAFGAICGIRLEAGYRDRHAAMYYNHFKEFLQLGGFISYSDVSTLGVKKKREQRVSLGAAGSATLVLEDSTNPDQRGRVHEDARNIGYTVVMLLAVVLTQEIPADAYPGSETIGYEDVPGRGRRRLGLTFNMRERFSKAILIMGGSSKEYLARLDAIMDRIVEAIDTKSQHPDVCIEDYMNKYANMFVLGLPAQVPSSSGKGNQPTDRAGKEGGDALNDGGFCPGWVIKGVCRVPNKCRMKHPRRLPSPQ